LITTRLVVTYEAEIHVEEAEPLFDYKGDWGSTSLPGIDYLNPAIFEI